MTTQLPHHPLLEKQIKRAKRFSKDGTCDLDLLFEAISLTYTEQETLRDRHDRASNLMADEILESKKFLDLLINRYPGGLVWKNKDSTFIGCNEFVLKLYGLSGTEEIIGKTIADLDLPADYIAHYQQEENWVLANQQAKFETVYRLRKDGHDIYMSTSTLPLFDVKGNMFGTLGVLSDVSEKIRLDEELKRHRDDLEKLVEEKTKDLTIAKEQAEKSSQIKSDFLANMSHELRTPLNSILGMARMLTDSEGLNGEHLEMMQVIQKSSRNLLEIVNDILDISKIEAGSLVLETIGFDFRTLLSNILDAMGPIASSKGLELECSYKGDDLPYLKGDPLRLGRILTNLISNALKYTHEGFVRVDIKHAFLPSEHVLLCCSVEDSGIGIAKDKLDTIFEKFTQADETITRKYGGTGLGLAITKDLTEMMGGTIRVESELNKGSCFSVQIPFETTDQIEIRQKHKWRKENPHTTGYLKPDEARLLIAEDHPLNRIVIKKLLEHKGLRNLTIVEDGQQAVNAWANNSYDVILMDCHMPNLNGYEATKEIRQREAGSNATIPIIALTADAMLGTREKCIAAGMNEYISKPIEPDELTHVLSRWVNFSNQTKTTPQEKATPMLENAPANIDLLKDFADTREELKGYADMFLVQAEADIDVLSKNCTDGENAIWSETAHKLKGGAGTIGATKLHALCAQAQNMKTATSAERTKILAEITQMFGDIRRYLDHYWSVNP